tara:strand:+ start:5005 stop:5538 length:534 start_codon:yes stop_codon:yes gene_type:complete
MLNNRKNNFVKKDLVLLKSSFLQYPKFSKDNFVQSTQTRQLKLGFNTVFNQKTPKSTLVSNAIRFEYNSKQFREFFIFNNLVRTSISKFDSNNLKQFFFFLNCVLKERKKVPFYLLKRIKGGYMISVLGVICFVPRSLFKISLKQQLISFKLYKKSKKFARSNLKLNLVSSLIQKKI